MKMREGVGTISNYANYISNCRLRQMPYRIPMPSLQGVQLYIAIGAAKPDAVEYQLIHTCGPNYGLIESLTTSDYIVGQDTNNNWYGVFKKFNDSPNELNCFVVAITLTFGIIDHIYFSEEYCIDNNCGEPFQLIKGCYGNLDNLLSYDCEGVYFGLHAGEETPMGDTLIKYKHEMYLRGVEVSLLAIKNTFKQGRTRNFRTEKEKIYQFFAELVPEWYIPEIDAIFYRGEVFVGDTKYLVNETQFEKVEDCFRQWKPTATFKDSCYKSFSCETDPCADPAPAEPCCDPLGVSASVISQDCCDPELISAEVFPNCTSYTIQANTTDAFIEWVDCESGNSLSSTVTEGTSLQICARTGSLFASGDYVITNNGSC